MPTDNDLVSIAKPAQPPAEQCDRQPYRQGRREACGRAPNREQLPRGGRKTSQRHAAKRRPAGIERRRLAAPVIIDNARISLLFRFVLLHGSCACGKNRRKG